MAVRYADSFDWPSVDRGNITLAPARVGRDRHTGRIIMGWDHVEQSVNTLFVTRFHERVLRHYVGSFVPHMLGQSIVETTVTRFFWAIATAIDLWEPCYRVRRVRIFNPEQRDGETDAQLTTPEKIRLGWIGVQLEGIYRPRAHLGDLREDGERSMALVSRGGQWERAPVL